MDSVEVSVVSSPFGNLAPLYEVDPDADVLLIVPSSSQAFAPWEDQPHKINGVNGINGFKAVSGVNGINGAHKTTTAVAPSSRPGLRIKVSSRHLALASRVFSNKLQFTSTKATRQADGRVHLKLAEGFDGKAVSIVMNALHGRGSKVPRAVDLDTLAQIALFVDRFQLLDAVEVYAERWISNLENSIPSTYNRSLVLWIFISHVFRYSDIFKTVSKTAATETTGPIQTLGLPIREKITKHINTQRQTLLTTTLDLVSTTLDDLSATSTPCATHHCDALILGELIKSLTRQRLVWPRPAKPFLGVSFASVVAAVDAGLRVHREQMKALLLAKEEADAWFMKGVPSLWSPAATPVGTPSPRGLAGKVVSGGGSESGNRPGWGVVGGIFPVTPAGSPQPIYRNGHGCEARKVVWRLDGLETLKEGVEGLVLESGLGYTLY